MKIAWTGIESSGKSLQLSRKAEEIRIRNEKWFEVTGVQRTMAFNTPMSSNFVKKVEDSGIKFLQYKNLDDILYLEEADIFIDELIKFFPASGNSSLSNEQLHFVTQGAKTGIHLYSASQDLSQVHKQLRLLLNEVYVVSKVIGSKRPMKSAPPVKSIWGLCYMRQVSPQSFKGDSVSMETIGIPSMFFITRSDCERFDTSYKVPLTSLPHKKLRKQVEFCEEDGFKRVKYI